MAAIDGWGNKSYKKRFFSCFFLAINCLLSASVVATIRHEADDTQMDYRTRLNQMEELIKRLEKMNQIQEEEMAQMKISMEGLVEINPEKTSTRSTRSVNSTADSSWSKLHISPKELGTMTYGHYGVNIYGHSANDLPSVKNETKLDRRFFYAPISALNHLSAESSFNNITEQAEVRFRVEMWNQQVEDEVVKFTANLVGHPIRKENVRVLPLEKVSLSSREPSRFYQLSSQWIDYNGHQFLKFSLTCKRLSDCDYVANQMKSNPHQFDHFRLHFSLSSQTTERRETTIRIESIVTGEMMSKLIQRYPKAEEVLLTANDEKRLLAESMTNVMVDSFDDSTVVSTNSQQMIYKMLDSLLVSSRIAVKDQTKQMWESVFWNDDNYRPDRTSKTFNDIYKKLDKDNQKKLAKSFADSNKFGYSIWGGIPGVASVGGSTNVEWSHSETFSKEDIDKLFQESKETIQWDGEKFVPKPMTLSRINLNKVRDSQSFQERSVRVSYKSSMLSVGLHIHPNVSDIFTDELFEIKTKLEDIAKGSLNTANDVVRVEAKLQEVTRTKIPKLEDEVKVLTSSATRKPDCFRNEMPSSCRDLACLGYKLNGFYSVRRANSAKIETVHCDFTRSNSDSGNEIFEKRFGYIDHKTSPVYFYVQRNTPFPTNDAVVSFELERLNVGAAMNLASGTFTAPVNGIYHFAFSGVKNDYRWIHIHLRLNSFKIGSSFSGWHTTSATLSLHCTLRLRKGDRIDLFTDYDNGGMLHDSSNNYYTHFSGWLLEEELS